MSKKRFTMKPILWKKNDYDYDYKNGRGNFHDCFLNFLTIKSTFFVVHFGDGGEGGQEKHTFWTLVKMLINVNSP